MVEHGEHYSVTWRDAIQYHEGLAARLDVCTVQTDHKTATEHIYSAFLGDDVGRVGVCFYLSAQLLSVEMNSPLLTNPNGLKHYKVIML